MSTITSIPLFQSAGIANWIPSPLYRMTLDQYETMVASGAFSGHDRFQLINGYLVEKMTQHDPHATADELCGRALEKVIPAGWHVRSAKPVRLPPNSMPEPDRSLVRGAIRDFSARSPGPADIGLIVEVSVSNLAEDRQRAHLYAAAGIPIYWIVNVINHKVEVYFDPTPNGYKLRVEYAVGEHVPVIIDEIKLGEIPVEDFIP